MLRGVGRRLFTSSSSSRSSDRGISYDEEQTDSDETQPASPHPTVEQPRVVERRDEHIQYDAEGRVILYLSRAGLLSPTSKVRGAATDSFQNKAEPTGYNWKSVSDGMKESYFQEMQKRCCWDERHLSTTVVRKKWEKIAAVAYKDFVSNIKRKYEKNERHKIKGVLPHVLESWIVHWQKPEVKAKCEQASRNRRSGPDGPETGPVIHHRGSRNAELHALDQAKAKGIDFEYTGLPTFMRFRCVDDVWTDGRSKAIYDEVMRRVAEERAPLPGSDEERNVTPERVEEIYREVSIPNQKGRVLGTGCLSQMYSARSSHGGEFSSNPMQSQQEARIRELENRLKEKEENEARLKLQQEEIVASMKAQQQEWEARMKAQEERYARIEKERMKEFGELHRNMKLIENYLSTSTRFDSSTS